MCLLTNERYKAYQRGFSFGRLGHAPGVGLGAIVGGGGGGGWGLEVNFFFPKFNQIWCVSYYHEWHMQRHHFLGPSPLGPEGGTKRSNIIKSELHSQFQRFLNQTLCIFSQMRLYNNISERIFIWPLEHAKGWDLGVPWGVGGSKKLCFPKFNWIWCVSYLHEFAHAPAQFFGSPAPGALGRGQNFYFLNMVMWHIKLKGVSSRPGYTKKF